MWKYQFLCNQGFIFVFFDYTLPYGISGKREPCEFHWKVDLMEQQIQDLVDSIRKEGLDEANRERDRIIAQAKGEADRIVKEARENAAKMIDDATKECELRQQSTKASLVQASRDVALSLKGEINDQLTKILSQQIASSFDKDLVAKLVAAVVEAGLKDTTIEIAGEDAQTLVSSLSSSLASKLKNGLALKVGTGYDGARLVSNDGSGYIDLSADEMAGLLKPYLSDAVKALVFD